MIKHCHKFAMILLISAGFALAQGGTTPQQNPAPKPDAVPAQPSPAAQQNPASNPDALPVQPAQNPTAKPDSMPVQSGQPTKAVATSADVQTKIQSALQADPTTASVTANVTDSTVGLSGTVATQAAKASAGEIAKANAGTRKVSNNIKVSAAGSMPPK